MKRTKKKVTAQAVPSNSRELLLLAAKKIFSDQGYDRTSTRDIAKEAGVNISLISYHFAGKEGLYRTCLEESSKMGLETVERVLKKPASLDEFKTRFQIFIEEFIKIHISNPDTSCIVMRELTNGLPNPIVMDLFKNKFVVIFEKLIEYLNFAQKQKFIASGVNTEILGMMIMGSITHLLRTDNMRKVVMGIPGLIEPEVIDKTIAQLANNLLNGVIPR